MRIATDEKDVPLPRNSGKQKEKVGEAPKLQREPGPSSQPEAPQPVDLNMLKIAVREVLLEEFWPHHRCMLVTLEQVFTKLDVEFQKFHKELQDIRSEHQAKYAKQTENEATHPNDPLFNSPI